MTAQKKAEKAADKIDGDVQEQIDEEQAQGFKGDKVDPEPDESYTASAQGAVNEAKKES
jgi:hypothetical protein